MRNVRQSQPQTGSDLILSQSIEDAQVILEALGELSENISKAYQKKPFNKAELENLHLELRYTKEKIENFLSEKISLMQSFLPATNEFKQLYEQLKIILDQEIIPTEDRLKKDAPLPSFRRPGL